MGQMERPPGTPGPEPSKSYPVELKRETPDESKRIEDLHLYKDALRKIEKDAGEWFRIRVMTQSSAYSTRKRLKKILLAGDPHWELTVARIPDDPSNGQLRGVYVRYRTDEQMREAGE